MTSQPGATTVTLSRFEVGKPDQRRECSLQVADVIRTADELGATYPEVVQMLADASLQKNLPTSLAIDELPEGGRIYYRPGNTAEASGKKRKTKVGRTNMSPNLFPEQKEPSERDIERKQAELRGNMANVPQEADKNSDQQSKPAREVPLSEQNGVVLPGRGTKESEKPKGMFSWLPTWKKSDK